MEGAAANPGFEKIAEIEEVVGLAEEAFPLSHRDLASIKGGFNSQVQLSQILFFYSVNFLRS